jgi:hypothetical protein
MNSKLWAVPEMRPLQCAALDHDRFNNLQELRESLPRFIEVGDSYWSNNTLKKDAKKEDDLDKKNRDYIHCKKNLITQDLISYTTCHSAVSKNYKQMIETTANEQHIRK